jgi:hypothetical protein
MPSRTISGYRFFFYSNEGTEPPHIHVDRAEAYAKFWLTPIRLHDWDGFNQRELNTITRLIEENLAELMEMWNEHFRTTQRRDGSD